MANGDSLDFLPERLRIEVEKAASAQGRTVTEVMVEAVDRYLKDKRWASLTSYGRQKARERGLTETDVDAAIAEVRSPSR